MTRNDEITVKNKGEITKYEVIVSSPMNPELLKKYVDDSINEIEVPSLDGYATEEFVAQKLNTIDLSTYALKEELGSYATTKYVDSELNLKADKSQLEGLATKAWVEELLSGYVPIEEE